MPTGCNTVPTPDTSPHCCASPVAWSGPLAAEVFIWSDWGTCIAGEGGSGEWTYYASVIMQAYHGTTLLAESEIDTHSQTFDSTDKISRQNIQKTFDTQAFLNANPTATTCSVGHHVHLYLGGVEQTHADSSTDYVIPGI